VPDGGRVSDHHCELGHNAVPGQSRRGVVTLALPEGVGILHHLYNAAQERHSVAGACGQQWQQKRWWFASSL
jgi:hypothetical protein